MGPLPFFLCDSTELIRFPAHAGRRPGPDLLRPLRGLAAPALSHLRGRGGRPTAAAVHGRELQLGVRLLPRDCSAPPAAAETCSRRAADDRVRTVWCAGRLGGGAQAQGIGVEWFGGRQKAQDGRQGESGEVGLTGRGPGADRHRLLSQQPKPNGQSIPYGHGAHPLYHPSAYSHPHAAPGSYSPPAPHPPAPGPAPAPAAAAPAAAPEPQPQQAQQASMSYEQLKAAVEANPALMQQLPPEYQVHFSQLLGLPIPP